MEAQFVQDCSTRSPLLDHYATREYTWRIMSKQVKEAIAELNYVAWFPFTLENLSKPTWFHCQEMIYKGELYGVVTNSAINYIFKIN